MIQKKWKKTMLIAIPLVVLGSVAAFAAEGQSSNTLASATATAPNAQGNAKSGAVTSQEVSSQTLTPEELQALDAAKPAPVTASSTTSSTAAGGFSSTGTDQNLIDSNDPFNVQSGSTTTTASAGTASASTGDASASDENEEQASGGTFSLDLVKNLEITTNTTQGVLKLHFTSDDKGRLKLDGDLGGHKLSLEGDQAGQILSKLMQSMDLSDALTASMNGKASNLDPNVLSSLQTLHIDLKDGRKIDTNPKGKGPKGAGPKAEGRHDNGKHKGQEKHGK